MTRQRTRSGHTHKAVRRAHRDAWAPVLRRVRWIRRHRGWSYGQLAQCARLREETVRLVELGRWPATSQIVRRMADGLGVNPESLYPGGRAIFLHRLGAEMRRRFPAPLSEDIPMIDKPTHGDPDYNSRLARMCEQLDEPCFTIRAQDQCGARTVRFWADLAELGGSSPELVAEARRIAAAMDAWQTHKVPD